MKLEVISEAGKCFGLRNQIAILVNGDVVPCCLDHEGDIKLGNIFYDDLDEIINKERCKSIINGFQSHKLVEPLCKRCGFRSRFGDN
jgi:radical SAM protein with 4Fe4S-binding SPASM domain